MEKFESSCVDDSKTINVKQFEDLIVQCGERPNAEDVLDTADGHRTIDLHEFLGVMALKVAISKDNDEDEYLRAFHILDANDDGFIDTNDFRRVLNNLGEQATDEELLQLMEETDKDRNGLIDLEEFITMTTRLKSMSPTNKSQSIQLIRKISKFNVFYH